jgi:hypothetical protein
VRWCGADAAGFEWTDLPLEGRSVTKRHQRDELATGLALLVAGQAIRPNYPWLLRQRLTVMLTETPAVSDPAQITVAAPRSNGAPTTSESS